MEVEVCKFCKAEFYKGILNDKGKCPRCAMVYPDAETPEDIKPKNEEDKENEGRLKNIITNEITNMLEKYGVLERCNCGNLFHKRSPAQKTCGCGTKAEE